MNRLSLHLSVKYLLLFAMATVMAGCCSVLPVVKRSDAAQPSNFVVWTEDFRSEEQKNNYRIKLKTPKTNITGLLFLRKNNNEWLGTLTNEMFVKVFDFKVTDEKCELFNVVSMMDKWYIKKTVAADMYFFIHADNPNAPFFKRLDRFEQNDFRVVNSKKKQVLVGQDGVVRLINKRRRLQYELRKMGELDPAKLLLSGSKNDIIDPVKMKL